MQQQIDFTRAEQLGLLDRAVIPSRPRISAMSQKAVLRVIDSHGRGRVAWLAYETIAAEANVSVACAKRAVKALIEASLLCVERRKSACGLVLNHYLVVWSEVALLTRPSARVSPPVRAADEVPAPSVRVACESLDQSVTVRDQSVTVRDQSVMVTPPKCHHDTQTAIPPMKRPEPPPQSPSAAGGGWDSLIQDWQSRIGQITQLVRDAERRGESCQAFAERLAIAWRTATSPANAGKLAKPAGAVVYFLRNRCWPCEGVVDATDERAVEQAAVEVARRAERRAERDRDRERELVRLRMSGVVRGARAQGMPRELLRERLAASISRETVEAGGWSSVDEAIGDYWAEG